MVGKVIFVIVGVIVLLLVPIVYDILHGLHQQRTLQSRTDYPQIAAACVSLARSTADWSVEPSDPRVPRTIRSLSPRYIGVRSNSVTLEFHGTYAHYGYRVQQSEINSNLWTISYYTEHVTKALATITNR